MGIEFLGEEMEFNVENFVKEYEQKENEMIAARKERETKNPMCLSCSQYFPGCCACSK